MHENPGLIVAKVSRLITGTIDHARLSVNWKNIYNDFELNKNSPAEKFLIVQKEENRIFIRNNFSYIVCY